MKAEPPSSITTEIRPLAMDACASLAYPYSFVYFIFRYSYPSQGGLSAGAVRQQNIMKKKLIQVYRNVLNYEIRNTKVTKYDCETD